MLYQHYPMSLWAVELLVKSRCEVRFQGVSSAGLPYQMPSICGQAIGSVQPCFSATWETVKPFLDRYLLDLPMLAFLINGYESMPDLPSISLRSCHGYTETVHAEYLDIKSHLCCGSEIGYVWVHCLPWASDGLSDIRGAEGGGVFVVRASRRVSCLVFCQLFRADGLFCGIPAFAGMTVKWVIRLFTSSSKFRIPERKDCRTGPYY